jgi:arrestin-related trafficking adapter 4/5/7
VIVRSFVPTALEYQQSLDIENTWPGKVMYSIIVPHKAWAAGDTIMALTKFSPLSKGAKVISITSSITETVKLYLRAGPQETTRTLITTKHAIINGKAVCVEVLQHRNPLSLYSHHRTLSTSQTQSMNHTPALTYSPNTYSSSEPSTPSVDAVPLAYSESGHVDEAGTLHLSDERQAYPSSDTDTNDDVVTTIKITIPKRTTPTHSQEPIMVSHRIKWSILISNLDGHSSELRCSLPLHILDHLVLQEAQASTAQTRRLLFGDIDGLPEPEAETQLPSYSSHIRDLIPDFDYPSPERVPVPLVASADATPPSGAHSPGVAPPTGGHLPLVPSTSVSSGRSLAWINSQLLRQQTASSSGSQSRTSLPESRHGDHSQSIILTRSSSPETGVRNADSASPSVPAHATHSTSSHHGSASRAIHNILNTSLKPFSSISSPFSMSSRSASHPHFAFGTAANHAYAYPDPHRNQPSTTSPASSTSTPASPTTRFFTEVPDYEVASRGFAGGGVTPLSSMRDLPSYEEASHPSPNAASHDEVERTTGLLRATLQDN